MNFLRKTIFFLFPSFRKMHDLSNSFEELRTEQQENFQNLQNTITSGSSEQQRKLSNSFEELRTEQQENFQNLQNTITSGSSEQQRNLSNSFEALCAEQQRLELSLHSLHEKQDEIIGYLKDTISSINKIFPPLEFCYAICKDNANNVANIGNIRDTQNDFIMDSIRNKWRILDSITALNEQKKLIVDCPLCGHSGHVDSYEQKVSYCAFGGGPLKRFVCPSCDLIFGPLKMLKLLPEQLKEEYQELYRCYKESDTTPFEIEIFYHMEPEKQKIYLNFGAGAWNRTSVTLRENGYQVYDYEPFAPVQKSPWVLTTMEECSKIGFDGIFSNDLIEHLRYPVDSLSFMKKILNPGGKIIHASSCYEFAFENTRFHLFFFTGRSLQLLANKCGLHVHLSERMHPEYFSPMRYAIFSDKEVDKVI